MARQIRSYKAHKAMVGPTKVTELRQWGDGQTIVLYTENDELYHRLKAWKHCWQVVDYWLGNKVIGADLYFPKELEGELRKASGVPPKGKKKATPKQLEALANGRLKSPLYQRNRGRSKTGGQTQG